MTLLTIRNIWSSSEIWKVKLIKMMKFSLLEMFKPIFIKFDFQKLVLKVFKNQFHLHVMKWFEHVSIYLRLGQLCASEIFSEFLSSALCHVRKTLVKTMYPTSLMKHIIQNAPNKLTKCEARMSSGYGSNISIVFTCKLIRIAVSRTVALRVITSNESRKQSG